jgi:hypothetical protein
MQYQRAKTSYEVTASAAIVAHGKVLLTSVLVITNGTDAATVILYDKPSATGIDPANKLWESTVAGASGYGGRNWTFPVRCSAGIYCSISGTGASAIVEWI